MTTYLSRIKEVNSTCKPMEPRHTCKNNFTIDALIGKGSSSQTRESSEPNHFPNFDIPNILGPHTYSFDNYRGHLFPTAHPESPKIFTNPQKYSKQVEFLRSKSVECARKKDVHKERDIPGGRESSLSTGGACRLSKIDPDPMAPKSPTCTESSERSRDPDPIPGGNGSSCPAHPYYDMGGENGIAPYPYHMLRPQFLYPNFEYKPYLDPLLYPYLGARNVGTNRTLDYFYMPSPWNKIPIFTKNLEADNVTRTGYPLDILTPNCQPRNTSGTPETIKISCNPDHFSNDDKDNFSHSEDNDLPGTEERSCQMLKGQKRKDGKVSEDSPGEGAKGRTGKGKNRCQKSKSEKMDSEDAISPDRMAYLRDKYFAAYGSRFNPFTSFLTPSDIIIPDYLYQTSFFRKGKRIRTAFSPSQLLKLENAFEKNHYVVGTERKELAKNLALTETQVKVWFQNRRTKHKKKMAN